MAEPFLGQIMMFAGTFAPSNWAMCNGQLMPISQNQSLYNLIGTKYGGDGTTAFALPDLRGRIPIHMGQGANLSNRQIGESGGVEEVTLSVDQMPSHTHSPRCAIHVTNQQYTPVNNLWTTEPQAQLYPYDNSGKAPAGTMASLAIRPAGGGQPHSNLQPYLTVTYCICLSGLYPPIS